MKNSIFLKKLYIKSLTPFELLKFRRDHKFYLEKTENKFYLELWKESLSKEKNNKVFNDYCIAHNLDNSDVLLMTSPINKITGNINLPIWVHTLEEILDYINLDYKTALHKTEEKPFYQLLYPFLHFFYEKLKIKLINHNITVPSEEVLKNLESSLHQNLINFAYETLFNEFSEFKNKDNEGDCYNEFVLFNLHDRYQNLFLKYPMLARRLVLKTLNCLNFTYNVLQKFEVDKFEIENVFDQKFDSISNLHMNSGDMHNGESTIILEFKNAKKLVYKPTNGEVTMAYNSFLEWVNSSLGSNLKKFKVVDKEKYSWLEHVHNEQCDSISEIKAYYENAGILTGVAYFLNAKDYHYDNVIAAKNSPVLIDHETIVNPIIKENREKKLKIDNVLETLLLPTINENDPPYIAGFGSSVQQTSSIFITKIKNCNTSDMTSVKEKICKNLYKLNKPKLKDIVQNLADFEKEFVEGFTKFYNLIIQEKKNLLSKNSPLNNFKNLPIRFIYRPTGVYYKLINLLNKPEYLQDPIKYGIKIELLARAYSIKKNWLPTLNSERDQILAGDVPSFYTNTISNNLVLPSGDICDKFEFNAMETIYYKINNANKDDYRNQMHLIKKVISL